MFLLLWVASLSLVAHVLCTFVLRALVSDSPALGAEIFAIPNAPVMPYMGIRLLRVRYFLFWQPAPTSVLCRNLPTRILFFVTRLSGFVAPSAMLMFFLSGFVIAG